jgi:ribonuclease P protein component
VGNAPERNKIRRQIKSIFYEEKLFELSYDYVIIVYKQILRLSFQELKTLLLSSIKKEPWRLTEPPL